MKIMEGKISKPYKLVIYGPEGIGKSTLASQFPDPLFIDTEDGTGQLDVKRTVAGSFAELMQDIDEVKATKPCKTLVIDSADWAEKMCISDILISNHVTSIESFGYGKGYTMIKESFQKLLDALTRLTESGINVIMTAHSVLKKFEQPDEMGSYDRYELKLSRQTAPIVKEWCDALLFCNYKTVVVTTKNGKAKGTGGKRVIYTTHKPTWDAKNRFGLADEIEMNIDALKPITDSNKPTEAPKPKTRTTKAKPRKNAVKAKNEPNEGTAEAHLDLSDVPQDLAELMENSNVSKQEVLDASASFGHFPQGTEFSVLVEQGYTAFVIENWDKFLSKIKELRSEKLEEEMQF